MSVNAPLKDEERTTEEREVDTIQFRESFKTILEHLVSETGSPDTVRNFLSGGLLQIEGQVKRFLLPMAQRMSNSIKSKRRTATHLENGMQGADSQDERIELEHTIMEAQAKLDQVNAQIDECIIMLEVGVPIHDRIVAETGRGNLIADIKEKGEAKRRQTEAILAAAARRAQAETDEALAKADGQSDAVSRVDALTARFKAASNQ